MSWASHQMLTLDALDNSKSRVADKILEKEKDKPVGQVFDIRFSWDLLLDAAADVYLGVCLSTICGPSVLSPSDWAF